MKQYKLLTPGPLTTTMSVKQEMLFDHCTWDKDYMDITQSIRSGLLKLSNCNEAYTCVLMQGSGTFGVESVITSSVGDDKQILICSNGAYGLRMVDIAKHAKINYISYAEEFDKIPNPTIIENYLKKYPTITHVCMVHSETTTGILNDIKSVAEIVKSYGKVFIVDAMSSFGGVEINVQALDIDFIISSANKCIQGVPGFSFIIAKQNEIEKCKGNSKSLSLDLYEQWVEMNKGGKWRYTSPTHVVLAFAKAMKELNEEGGIITRASRYYNNNKILIEGMKSMGFMPYIDNKYQSPIITTFYYPQNIKISFENFYEFIKNRGYAIYPGKLMNNDTFRVANIGEIYEEDIHNLLEIIREYLRRI